MSVTGFELRTCPPVSPRYARTARAALPSLAMIPERWQTDRAASGPTLVTFEGLTGKDPEPDDVVLAVALGTRVEPMTVDADFATRVVDAVLGGGRDVFRSARRLGPAEKGMVASLLADAFQPLGWRIGLGQVPPAQAGVAQACFRLATPIATGRVWLALDASPLPETPFTVEAFRQRAARTSIVLSVEVAVTDVAAGAIAVLAPGDAVVFDGYRGDRFVAETAWHAELAIGELGAVYAAPVEIDDSGKITIGDKFEARGDAVGVRRKETEMDVSGNTAATVALAGAPIEVVAEIGRLKLRGDEVLGLAAGAVLTLPHGRHRVSLRVAGELMAEGELVDVDGELGVRVTRIVAR